MKKFNYGFNTILTIVFLIYPQITLASPLKIIKNSPQSHSLNVDCKLSEQKESIYLAQKQSETGCWKLIYSVAGIVYESILVLRGDRGKMLTTFFSRNTERIEQVEQTMKVTNSARGILILGSNPVYYNTNTRHPTYSPDNFLLQVMPSGETRIGTCDRAGQCSDVDVEDCPL